MCTKILTFDKVTIVQSCVSPTNQNCTVCPKKYVFTRGKLKYIIISKKANKKLSYNLFLMQCVHSATRESC